MPSGPSVSQVETARLQHCCSLVSVGGEILRLVFQMDKYGNPTCSRIVRAIPGNKPTRVRHTHTHTHTHTHRHTHTHTDTHTHTLTYAFTSEETCTSCPISLSQNGPANAFTEIHCSCADNACRVTTDWLTTVGD